MNKYKKELKMLLSQNSKMKKSSDSKYIIYNFTLPAVKTCPSALACKKGCYATQGTYNFSNVKAKHEQNYRISQALNFIDLMDAEVKALYAKAEKRGKKLVIRIHDSGDFYDMNYINKWLKIMELNSNVLFYAYTKQIKIMQTIELPLNFTTIASFGGVFDHLISNWSRHAKVFESLGELEAAGYIDASHDDTIAFLSLNPKIGLIYHGAKSYTKTDWSKTA